MESTHRLIDSDSYSTSRTLRTIIPFRHASCPRLQAHPAEAIRGGADGRAAVRHRPQRHLQHRRRHRRNPGPRRRSRHRDRRRQHLPRRRGERQGHGPRHRRLHGNARDGHQRARDAGRARAERRAHARGHRDRDARRGRAVHPPPRDPPPREGPRGDFRRRHGQSRTSPPTRPRRCARWR